MSAQTVIYCPKCGAVLGYEISRTQHIGMFKVTFSEVSKRVCTCGAAVYGAFTVEK